MSIAESPVMNRMATIWASKRKRELTEAEMNEMALCLNWLVNYMYRQAHLRNLSLMASMIDDVEWQHEICKDID